MNLVELLQSIADAIRTKTKGTDKINAQDFPTAIANIKGGSGNATSADVLSGKTFTNDDGEQTGAMANNGTISTTISQGGSYTIPQGYHSGSGVVKATANSGNASTSQVLSGYTFYSNSATKQTGTMTNQGTKTVTISPGGSYTIPQGYHSGSGKVSATSNTFKYWNGGFSGTGSYTCDFGSACKSGYAQVTSHIGGYNNASYKLEQILVSNDNSNWTTKASVTGNPRDSNSSTRIYADVSGYRYVKINVSYSSFNMYIQGYMVAGIV